MAHSLRGIEAIGGRQMQLKSFLTGGAVVAVLVSVVMAEQISVPNQFTAGSPARAAEVNANFDALVLESNAQDTRISDIDRKVGALENVEQLFCYEDPRLLNKPSGGSTLVGAFPFPEIIFTVDEMSVLVVSKNKAICVAPETSSTVIERDIEELASEGWRFVRAEMTLRQNVARLGGPRLGDRVVYIFERAANPTP